MDSWRLKAIVLLIFILSFVLSVCDADEYCGSPYGIHYRHCDYGCCGLRNDQCCDPPVALIAGLSVGGVVFIVGIIILVYSCYRRNREIASQCHLSHSQPVYIYQADMGMITSASFQLPLPYNPYRQFPADNLNSHNDLTMPMQSTDNSLKDEECDPIPKIRTEPCTGDDEIQSDGYGPVAHNSMKEEICDPIPQVTIHPCTDSDDESQSDGHCSGDNTMGSLDKK